MTTAAPLNEDDRPGVADHGESHWTGLAQKHWSKPVKTKTVKPAVIKTELWDVLEKEGFDFRILLTLESLQLLEK